MGGSAVEPLFFNLPVICRLEEGERVHACPFARSRHLVSMSLVSKTANYEIKLSETKVYLIASKIDNCNDSFSSKEPSITLSIIWCSKFFEIFPAAT